MTLIALTGGIASGKSTIGKRLAELGATRIDADLLAREVVEPGTQALADIRKCFGREVLTADGRLDRQALATTVFGHPDQLQKLNDIVHPAVRELASQKIAAARGQDPTGVVVYEIPLLVETRKDDEWDLIVVADAPADVRIARLVELREFSSDEAEKRVLSQATDSERRAIADVIIDTSGTLQQTLEQVDELWRRLTGGKLDPAELREPVQLELRNGGNE